MVPMTLARRKGLDMGCRTGVLSVLGVLACLVFPVSTAATAVAAPGDATDARGFLDSTARCEAPSTAVAFGRTASSRVAICTESSGQYQYRGVRVRDGARLILAAEPASGGGYVAENDGITYTVTSGALTISAGGRQIRQEPMVDFRGPTSSTPPSTSNTTSTPSTSTAPSVGPAPADTPAPTTPLPPPLPAEVGGG